MTKHDPAGRGTGKARTGTSFKTVLADVGPVEIDVPRDRDASFEPKIAPKRQKRLGGVDEMVSSLADHFHHHRQGGRGHDRMSEPAAGDGAK
ncbi:transposase [Amycolatopsis keratiniphila]